MSQRNRNARMHVGRAGNGSSFWFYRCLLVSLILFPPIGSERKVSELCFRRYHQRLPSPSMESKPLLPTPPHRKFAVPLLASLLLLSSLFLSTSFFSSSSSSLSRHALLLFPFSHRISSTDSDASFFVENKLRLHPPPASAAVPRLAYLVSGSAGDGPSILRVLRALYHPSNSYVLHLDLEAPASERLELAAAVRSDPVYSRFGNVRLVSRANLVTYRGPTMVANTLHAAAILLKEGGDWDWFINLSASDYPLVTQDDMFYTLSAFPRHLNFIEHTSDIGWKEGQRAKPVIVDPGLYTLQKSDVFWVSEKRSLPTAFKLFTGSAWMMLSHQFVEFCVWGWDNLPRTVLMYYANFLSSPEGYFHTVICNAPEFRNTTVNHDLHFIYWDNPPKQHPHFLTIRDFVHMVKSNAPFARKFSRDDPVLNKIDEQLLGRHADGFVPSAWQDSFKMENDSSHYSVKDVGELKPGLGADRLKRLITGLLSANGFDDKHCL
ncbi:Beta-glucuronosyltransferase GlcAT14A [Canna indica]|uniref:Beta-glucuronosyltransferase GlcAT14A n=1 Tax=Canna indica TaxID=4628 RepID=A0AAQ3JSD2_9LILI|nr:Beta-glucuronosyltransferase GlcAT14A [Canna indica]